jgi:hypothetical protein
MILIVTSKRDGHIEAVSKHLDAASASWARINVEDFATNVEIKLEPATGAGILRLKDSGVAILVESIRSVWYRKPEPVAVQHFSLEPAALDYIEAEFTEVVYGLYALLNRAFWINDPFTTRIAHRKLLQLRTASEVGFDIPKTIITNKPAAAVCFAKSIGGDVAIKSLGAISVTEDRTSSLQ